MKEVLILWPKIDDFEGNFSSNFSIGKYRGRKIQMVIFSSPSKIASFPKKRLLRSDEIFDISETCKNDPGPPYRLNFLESTNGDCLNYKSSVNRKTLNQLFLKKM